MKASEKLLNLNNHYLEVFKNSLGVCVCYQDADVLSTPFRISEYGVGKDFEEACENYVRKISGKKIVFGEGKDREEITVLF